MIRIKGLSAGYGDEDVLSRLNLELVKGELYAMIGPSGSGKSTLLKILCGIKKDYTGSIEYDGRPYGEKELSIGYVPQNYGLLDWKTVKENIYLPQKLNKSMNKSLVEQISEVLEISPLFKKFPCELSGGQKQRVSLARAFAMEPDLLLMDEPFSALDAFTSAVSQELFLKIWSEHKVTALFITHNINEAVAVGKHIVIMNKDSGNIAGILENTAFGRADSRQRTRLADEITDVFRQGVIG